MQLMKQDPHFLFIPAVLPWAFISAGLSGVRLPVRLSWLKEITPRLYAFVSLADCDQKKQPLALMHLNSVERLSAAPPPERGAVPRLAQGHLCGGSEGSGKTFLTQFPPHRLAGPVWELGEEGGGGGVTSSLLNLRAPSPEWNGGVHREDTRPAWRNECADCGSRSCEPDSCRKTKPSVCSLHGIRNRL